MCDLPVCDILLCKYTSCTNEFAKHVIVLLPCAQADPSGAGHFRSSFDGHKMIENIFIVKKLTGLRLTACATVG